MVKEDVKSRLTRNEHLSTVEVLEGVDSCKLEGFEWFNRTTGLHCDSLTKAQGKRSPDNAVSSLGLQHNVEVCLIRLLA